MPSVTHINNKNTGHDACPGVPLIGGSSSVFVNGIQVGRIGDPYAMHGCEDHSAHTPHLAAGSSTVFADGVPVGRVGDAVDCGGVAIQGSPDVYAG
ncbi:MAG: PAAR domain-containing protein [Desulfovibrionaceae bacterium]|nr:PAAR domain-containing protein [Desulfovibrionaceae bacterium]